VFVLLAVGGASLAGAEPDAAAPAALRPAAERARAVFEAHCAACHQEGRVSGRAPDRFGTILDLGILAATPRLVVPGRPDASFLYQRLLGRHTPLRDYGAPGAAGPTAAEIESVRDWIESLPRREAECRDRALVTPDAVEELIGRWVETVGVAQAKDTRFVSLAHLYNACLPERRLADFRETVGELLAAVASVRDAPRLETLGDASAVLAFRPSEVPLDRDDWEWLIKGAPMGETGAVPADWLASRVLVHARLAADSGDALAGARFVAATEMHLRELGGEWTADVDLARAAAEVGVEPHALRERLAGLEGELGRLARRLAHGVLAREEWERVRGALDGLSPLPAPESPPAGDAREAPSTIDLQLWTDKPVYAAGDLATINVSVSKACHLTLIDVDQDGKAIVLYPNELEPDNLIAPGVTVRVPGNAAGYQFRFERAGEEEIVAVCQRTARRPEGVVYDYERQRFAVVGDWRTFLRTSAEREAAAKTSEPPRRRRRGLPGADPELPAIDPAGPALEGRAAIYVTIAPGL
jgi:mono/diheme cytochrome c family protein